MSSIEDKLDKIIRMLEEIDTTLYMQVFQHIELNRLLKKLNYISGTDEGLSPKEVAQEIEFLNQYVDCIKGKGTLCPIKGIVKKFGKHVIKDGEEKVNE